MAHELEKTEDGSFAMAYAASGGVPWHGHGFPVTDNLSPKQMMKASRTSFRVEKAPAFATIRGKKVQLKTMPLYRTDNGAVLSEVPFEWNPIQNEMAYDFFKAYCKAGHIKMETAGSLRGGRLVWVMAKINNSFALFNGKDVIESYLLFTNPHVYGMTASVSLTEVRVVCKNTLNLSLNNTSGDKIVRITHRTAFDPEQVKETLGLASARTAKYKEAAEFLASQKADDEDIVSYFKRIFPVLTKKEDSTKDMSTSAARCMDLLDKQPGAEFGQDTWWKPYNAVTCHLDHEHGRNSDNRLHSSWYGAGRKLKVTALNTALEMAGA